MFYNKPIFYQVIKNKKIHFKIFTTNLLPSYDKLKVIFSPLFPVHLYIMQRHCVFSSINNPIVQKHNKKTMSICLSITRKKQLHLHTKQIVLIKIITHNIILVRIGETIQIDAKEYKKTSIEILIFHQCIKNTSKTNILYNRK